MQTVQTLNFKKIYRLLLGKQAFKAEVFAENHLGQSKTLKKERERESAALHGENVSQTSAE